MICTDEEAALREVKVIDLRAHLPAYLADVLAGEEIRVVSRGKIIARIVPERDEVDAARSRLLALRGKARLGDVPSPLDEEWDAQR